MIREALAAGLTGLGLVGGTAAIKYDDSGAASVKLTEGGRTATVTLGVVAGEPRYSCPYDIDDRLEPRDKLSARIKLTLRGVGAELDQLEMQYPGAVVEPAVASRYRGLARRERQLAKAFNRSVAKHNAFLKEECTEH